MPVELVAERFSTASLAVVQGLNCGDDEWGRVATDWIKSNNPDDSALSDMQNLGTEVFLYFQRDSGRIVGFGSLGLTKRQVKGVEFAFSIIPHVGIDKDFHGQPPGPWEERISTLVMLDLIHRAIQLEPNELSLFVHKNNAKARKLYDRLGFKPVGNVTQRDLQRMILQVH